MEGQTDPTNQGSNNRINELHKRKLRLVYSDNNQNFEELLEKDGSLTLPHNNN